MKVTTGSFIAVHRVIRLLPLRDGRRTRLPGLVFPGFSELAGTLAAFSTFGVAFVARPVGGMVFGHYGDKVGRKAMLVITLC